MTKELSWKIDPPAALPPFDVVRKGPHMDLKVIEHPEKNVIAHNSAIKKFFMWLICRMIGSKERQCMPGFGGFVSKTGSIPTSTTTIGYYPTIHEPITEYKVVREILRKCEAKRYQSK